MNIIIKFLFQFNYIVEMWINAHIFVRWTDSDKKGSWKLFWCNAPITLKVIPQYHMTSYIISHMSCSRIFIKVGFCLRFEKFVSISVENFIDFNCYFFKIEDIKIYNILWNCITETLKQMRQKNNQLVNTNMDWIMCTHLNQEDSNKWLRIQELILGIKNS